MNKLYEMLYEALLELIPQNVIADYACEKLDMVTYDDWLDKQP
jgi:hypothetical protein